MAQVVVAVRGGPLAKSRLGALFGPGGGEGLAQAMLADMLEAVQASAAVTHIRVVTPTPTIAEFAAARGATVILEPAACGLDAAFERARSMVAQSEPHATLALLPGDLPLLATAELDEALAAHRHGEVVMTPASADGGTGAIILEASAALPFSFGYDSFSGHLAAARRIGLKPRVFAAPTMSFDVDRPADLDAVASADGGACTRAYIRERAGGA